MWQHTKYMLFIWSFNYDWLFKSAFENSQATNRKQLDNLKNTEMRQNAQTRNKSYGKIILYTVHKDQWFFLWVGFQRALSSVKLNVKYCAQNQILQHLNKNLLRIRENSWKEQKALETRGKWSFN